jgi:UDP-N-acetylglucosamine 2-epimerase (hydrolysing)
MRKILVVMGTRPEAIKMAPVIQLLRAEPFLQTIVCLTAQHRHMLDQVLEVFGIKADLDLQLMKQEQQLGDLSGSVLKGIDEVIGRFRPDCALVHGDTTTAMAASMAAFYQHIPVGHVEAGLRTNDMQSPWPEEMNRRVIDMIASYHFAPTQQAYDNLLKEGVAAERVFLTGNTVIDALLMVLERFRREPELEQRVAASFPSLDSTKRLILVSGHRRENHGKPLLNVCHALKKLSGRHDIQILFPVHPNPKVHKVVREVLAGDPRILLTDPLDYLQFVYLMRKAHFILTDSGGIQEEATTLGKQVLLLRQITERPEAVAAGAVKIVGTDTERIIEECEYLLGAMNHCDTIAGQPNPFGDGLASKRIVAALRDETFPSKKDSVPA